MKINLTPLRIQYLKTKKLEQIIWDSQIPKFGVLVKKNGTKRYIHLQMEMDILKKNAPLEIRKWWRWRRRGIWSFCPVWTLEIQLKISIERDEEILAKVMNAIHCARHYEEPVIFLREDWASCATYSPNSDNPNRWWNNGRGMPDKIQSIASQ